MEKPGNNLKTAAEVYDALPSGTIQVEAIGPVVFSKTDNEVYVWGPRGNLLAQVNKTTGSVKVTGLRDYIQPEEARLRPDIELIHLLVV